MHREPVASLSLRLRVRGQVAVNWRREGKSMILAIYSFPPTHYNSSARLLWLVPMEKAVF